MASTLEKFNANVSSIQLQTKRTGIYLWSKQKNKLVQPSAQTGSTLPPDAEVHLVKCVNAYRAYGLPISSLMLHRKALCVARGAGTPARLFGATWGWVKIFLRCHLLEIRTRTRQVQVTSENADTALKYFNASQAENGRTGR
ncbi:hypothetical protein PHPALM_37672 [Phytophthora palmivora]|uniref:HTH CENPB-type domain-containing protein n=1 Tax=Phytophthora palmivora TaxID=4796 RepID=A0A2P4WWU7_9STRA|nr:hypothetical protein PHPALM_37672 [Phytophthora palmivora]